MHCPLPDSRTRSRTARLRGDILHYSFRTVSEHLQTIDRFSETAARNMFEAGKRASVLTPVSHGAATFVKTYLLKRGFLDRMSAAY